MHPVSWTWRISDRDLQHLVALYDGEIAYCDAQIGVLLVEMERMELLANTVIIQFFVSL